MIRLVSILIQRAIATASAQRGTLGAVATAVAIWDFANIGWFREQSIAVAPGSDPAAIEEASRTAMRLLGLQGDEVLWPRSRDGTPITPVYLTIDLTKGRAWYHGKYYSRKSVNAGRRKGFGRGMGAGRRQAVDNKIIAA